jgi:L-lysine 2,3-aminomutase
MDDIKVPDGMLDKVTGGLTEERKAYLDTYIQRCKTINTTLKKAMEVLNKNGATLEELMYVREHW